MSQAASNQLIVFRVGGRDLGVDIMAVREIRAYTPATELPHVPPHVRGVINLRGAVLPVVDLSERLGWGRVEAGERHVIIVVRAGGRLQGLIVESVSDIVRIDAADTQAVPVMAAGEAGAFLSGLIAVDDRMVLLLDLDRLALGGTADAALAA